MQLVIKSDTWHYRFFIFIRNFWGCQTEPDSTSLCPYVQTLLWGSFFAVALFPLFILGWLMLKFSRVLYKTMENLGYNNIIDALDGALVGDAINRASTEGMDEKPAWTMLGSLFLGVSLLILGLLLLYLAFNIVIHIPDFPAAIWGAFGWVVNAIGVGLTYVWMGLTYVWMWLTYIGLGLFMVFYWIGWLFTAGWLWLIVLKWTGYVAAVATVSFVFCFGIYKASTSKTVRKLIDALKFKLNGFTEAREKASERRDRQRLDKLKDSPGLGPRPPGIFRRMWRFVKDKTYDIDIDIIGNSVKVLSPLGAIVGFIVAAKKGVCPIVSFVDPDVLAFAAADTEFDPAKENLTDYADLFYALSSSDIVRKPKRSLKAKWINGEHSASIKSIVARLIMGQVTVDQAIVEVDKLIDVIKKQQKDNEPE